MTTRHPFVAETSRPKGLATACSLALGALALLGAVAVGCGPKAEAQSPSTEGEGGATKALVDKKCSTCHGMDKVTAVRGDAAKWTAIMDTMIGKGLKVSEKEKSEIIAYLAANQGM